MKRLAVRTSALFLVVLIGACAAFAWAPGTHTFIASQLRPRTPGYTYQQMYGAVVADVDEFFTASPDYATYFYATHYSPTNVWNAAKGMPVQDRALAFGFVSHNEAWGADHNAHIGSFLYGPNRGYVITKARALCGMLRTQLHAAGMDAYLPIITDMNCHFIVEYGMDILMTYRDPNLGMKVYTAAASRDAGIGLLLMWAFPITLAGQPTVGEQFAYAESMPNGWNDIMKQYGMVLSAPVGQRVPVMSQFLTALATQMGILPPASSPEEAAAMQKLIELALVDSMVICAPDLQIEVNATIIRVNAAMKAHGVNY
jgi:hypothetical protein